MISFSEACLDPNLFGPWFQADSWSVWRVIDRALFGEPLTDDELAIFATATSAALVGAFKFATAAAEPLGRLDDTAKMLGVNDRPDGWLHRMVSPQSGDHPSADR